MDYKISVIIPTYNAEKYLMDAVDSVINQTIGFENIELLLIDDNSNDGTKELLKDLSLRYDNIRSIFLDKNTGSPSKPRNIGIKESNAEYIMFLDNDDAYKEDICEKLYSAAKKYDADMVNCRLYFTRNGENVKEENVLDNKEKLMILNSIEEDTSLLVSMAIWNKIYRKSLILEHNIEFPVYELYEDAYFNIQSYINSSKIISLNDYYGIYYTIRDTSTDKSTSNNFKKENLTKNCKGFKKILNYLDGMNKFYPDFECPFLIGFTKWILITDCEKEYKMKVFREFKKYYKRYVLFIRYDNLSILKNSLINLFIKFISLNDVCFKLIVNLFEIDWFKEKLLDQHIVN